MGEAYGEKLGQIDPFLTYFAKWRSTFYASEWLSLYASFFNGIWSKYNFNQMIHFPRWQQAIKEKIKEHIPKPVQQREQNCCIITCFFYLCLGFIGFTCNQNRFLKIGVSTEFLFLFTNVNNTFINNFNYENII